MSNIRLELTQEEAQAVLDVLACVGGDPSQSRRKYTEAVLTRLKSTGLTFHVRGDASWDFEPHADTIYFESRPNGGE